VGGQWRRSFQMSKVTKSVCNVEDLPGTCITNCFLPAQSLIYLKDEKTKVTHDMPMHWQKEYDSTVPKHSQPCTRKRLLVSTTILPLYPGKNPVPPVLAPGMPRNRLDGTWNISPHLDSITVQSDPQRVVTQLRYPGHPNLFCNTYITVKVR
jgi:hypothetical protein